MKTVPLVVGLILLGGSVQAAPGERIPGWPGMTTRTLTVVPGVSVRNGDWFVFDGVAIVLLNAPAPTRAVAVVARGEVGPGGASLGVGIATNATSGANHTPGVVDMSDFLGSGIVSLEARAERTYGVNTWRRTTYAGGQLSFAAIIFKPSVGLMVDAHDRRDAHVQIAFMGVGW